MHEIRTLEDVSSIAGNLGFPCIVPLVKVIKSPLKPVDVYASIRKNANYSFLLESAIVGEKIARYSFLGSNPSEVIKVKDGILEANGKKAKTDVPLRAIREHLSSYNVYNDGLPSFSGGLLGYLSYDMVRYFEGIGNYAKDDLCHPDMELVLAKDLIVFDHWREEVLLVSNLILEDERDLESAFEDAKGKIEELEEAVKSSGPVAPVYNGGKVKASSNFKREDFIQAVEKAKECILDGEIFQVVLSQRFESEIEAEPLNVYLILKEVNPSPYMYFLEFEDRCIIGSSPEILVKCQDRKVVVRPIAGTRPRGNNAVEDEDLARSMLNDPKERAEHVMLVDLGRNDIGKVSSFGSVCVNEFMGVERYSHVQHMVSNVVGELEEGKDTIDALEAAFPAGTVSGAPKIRAMEIIEELEPVRRGIYAGSVGYLSFSGDMDFAITIRTIVVQDGKAYVQAGAGIVADSVPEREYEETANKARAMLKSIELAGGGA